MDDVKFICTTFWSVQRTGEPKLSYQIQNIQQNDWHFAWVSFCLIWWRILITLRCKMTLTKTNWYVLTFDNDDFGNDEMLMTWWYRKCFQTIMFHYKISSFFLHSRRFKKFVYAVIKFTLDVLQQSSCTMRSGWPRNRQSTPSSSFSIS